MLKPILAPLVLPLLLLFSNGPNQSGARLKQINNGTDRSVARVQQNSPESQQGQTGTLEKMMVADGSAALDIDLNTLNGIGSASQVNSLRFTVEPNSFFTILVFNKVLRGPLPGSMALIPQSSAVLPDALNASFHQLVVEKTAWTEPFDLVVRDSRTGFTIFNIEGNLYDYEPRAQMLTVKDGRLLVSEELAKQLGRPADVGSVVGKISITATMRVIETTQLVNGEVKSAVQPPLASLVPGPDVIVGVLPAVQQFGSSGTQVGLAVATDSCNAGAEPLRWFAMPSNDHPVIPQNLYRMSGGASNDERFEQIGQSWLKHAFTALQQDACGFGCQSSGTGTLLGAGCSDPYSASLNASQGSLGSRAWVNPFTGAYPRGDSSTPPRDHTGHSHTGTSHRVVVESNDLNTTLNPGATYYAEAQYVTPHEFAWCQANLGQCNMYNNTSYRRFNVSGTSSFTFSAVGATVQTKPALVAWTGATINSVEPAPGVDGVAFVGYKVTNPSPGVWHYEYAVYNQNLDRAIQSFSVPLAPGAVVNNIGFHAPPQPAAFANDGTVGSAGYSSTPWSVTQTSNSLTWNSETLAQNPNANAIRWGTLYNFRFDSDRPPQTTNATVGFFKTGTPSSVQIQGPLGAGPTPLPSLIISEFRFRGPSGTNDEFIEVYNNTGANHTVAGGGTGYAIAASDGVARCVIPNGTVIPNGGHFLCTNSQAYSLSGYATGDAAYTTDIPDNAGIALFNTSVGVNFIMANRLDAVGSTSEANALYKEGTGYAALTPLSIDYSFVRDECGKGGSIPTGGPCPQGGLPKDTNNNAADIFFLDTNGTNAGAGQRLGAPGPQNLASPLNRNGLLTFFMLDTTTGGQNAPNRVRDLTSDPPNNSTFGTLDIRRRIFNNTGASVTRLRFRIMDFTTFSAPTGIADLRAKTSALIVVSGVNDPATCSPAPTPCTVNVQGTTLEQPPSQPNGGGFNSSMSAGTVTLGTPLAPGASINVRFVLGIQQTGSFRFFVNVEALP